MYLIKKVSKNGKTYFTLVIKKDFSFDGSITYVNMGYSKGLELADMFHITIYEDNLKGKEKKKK